MANVYEVITDRIIKQLESGTAPWHKPWSYTRPGRAAPQPGEQAPVSRHQCLDPGQQWLFITVLADLPSGHRTWRTCSQWPKGLTGRVLEVRHTRSSGR